MNKYVTPKSKIIVDFKDLPENNTRKNINEIKSYVAKRMGVDKTNVTVNFIAVKKDVHGELIEIEGANIENIMDSNYQQQLFKEYIEREEITINFEDILKFDNEVTNELNGEFDKSIYNNWSMKWVEMNNFLSYAPTKNRVEFQDLEGLNIVTSSPRNFGGKSTAFIDAILFLFMGTTTKTTKNEEVFNKFSDSDSLYVKAGILLGGDDIIIERILNRKAKKDGTWNVSSVLKLKRILSDGTVEDMKEEDAIKTTAEIKKLVGTESTFNLTILATGNNLYDLINLKPTENSSVINKLIGLEVLEAKEAIARKKLNEFNKSKISNILNPIKLMEEIDSEKEVIEILQANIEKGNVKLAELAINLGVENSTRDKISKKYNQINVSVSQSNPEQIQKDMDELKETGVTLSDELKSLEEIYEKEYKDIVFDDAKYHVLVKDRDIMETQIRKNKAVIEFETEKLKQINSDEGKCHVCGSVSEKAVKALERIRKETKDTISTYTELNKQLETPYNDLLNQIEELKSLEAKTNEKAKLEVKIAKKTVEVTEARHKFIQRRNDMKVYTENQEAIEENKKLDLQLGVLDTNIKIIEKQIADVRDKLVLSDASLTNSETIIKKHEENLRKIEIEAIQHKLYNTYVEMVGKKGINKLVVRSLIPVINNELHRILDGTIEFKLEMSINDKNDIEYTIIEGETRKPAKAGSGYEKTLSSLALRCVLAKVSHLPMPNFIVFDEIMGQVSPENYHLVQIFLNRIKMMFDSIYFISHDERTQDWGDNLVMIEKVNSMSKIV